MTSLAKVRSELKSFIGNEKIASVRRASRPAHTIDGFVVAVGRKWVLLSKVMDGGYFDGHTAIRIADIRSLRLDSSFQSAFAKTRPEWPPAEPSTNSGIDLDSTAGMLKSLLQRDQLFGIERKKKYHAIWIGVPDELRKRWLYIWEVDSRGQWDPAPLGYKLDSITTVVFGDHYQTALKTIAGDPPLQATSEWTSGTGQD